MPFAPCNIQMSQLVERQAKVKAIGHERRQQKMQRNAMPPEVADHYARFDAAVLVALETLKRIHDHEPEVVERYSRPLPTAHTTAPHSGTGTP